MPNPWTGIGNPYTRTDVLERLHDTLAKGEAIAASGIGPPGPKAGRRPPLIRTSAMNASGSSGLWFHCILE